MHHMLNVITTAETSRRSKKQYEKELRYSKGIEYIEVDTYGREINRINNNNIPAFPGKNLILSIDSSLQQFSKNLLSGQKGVILVSNVNNGDILSMVSNPSYSLDIYRGETTDSEWNALLSDAPGGHKRIATERDMLLGQRKQS